MQNPSTPDPHAAPEPTPIPQVDYRANPSFAGDVTQEPLDRDNPNAAPAAMLPPVLVPPDPDEYMCNQPPLHGYVQEGFALTTEPTVREQLAQYTPDVAGEGHRSW